MSVSIENYPSQQLTKNRRRQAYTVWGVALLLVSAWNAIIVLAPVAMAQDYEGFALPIYKFFGYICHQIPSRSLHLVEHQLAVCSRCFGVYFGLLAGFLGYPLVRRVDDIEPIPRFWLFLAMIPIGIDWALGVLGIWENTHLSRFVTGLILGAACALFIVPALVEVFRLWSGRNKYKRLSN